MGLWNGRDAGRGGTRRGGLCQRYAMGLQIRLRHALGERMFELSPRTVDRPMVIGRAADADVQIPSVNVAPRQSVLFVHDGYWVVQEASDSAGTYVNGEPIAGPTFLQI